MLKSPLKKLKSALAPNDGQALVMAVLGMFALLVISSYVIDVGLWNAKRAQAQSAADAAALAASDCLASNSCSTTYTNVATTIARQDAGSSATVNVTTTGNTVSVGVTNTTQSAFSAVAGVSAPRVASSAAAVHSTPASAASGCATAMIGKSDCLALFAGDTCATDGGNQAWGIWLDLGNSDFKGTILSDADVFANAPTWQSNSPIYYGATSAGCATTNHSLYNVTYDGTNGTTAGAVDTPQQLSSYIPYPEDWSAPSQVGSYIAPSNSTVNETTPTCTYTPTSLPSSSSTTLSITASGTEIYISGSGTLPPGTYCTSGEIYIACSSVITNSHATLIANWIYIEPTAAVTMSPCVSTAAGCSANNQLLMMQTGTQQLNVWQSSVGSGTINGAKNLTGTIFAPYASEIYVYMVNSVTGLVEGGQVWYCMNANNNTGAYSGTGVSAAALLNASTLTN